MKDDRLINWSKDLLENERNNTGGICKTGEIEIREIAKRLRDRIHFDENPLRTFEDDYVEIECLYDFVVVKKEGTEDIVTWKVNDLIVI